MNTELSALLIAALSIGFFHTLLGPDHYLPFVMLSWSRKWSTFKTGWITLLCGLGHVLSSVVLGIIGVAIGIAVEKLEFIESSRGSVAAWLMIIFGLVYSVWGIRQAIKNRPHKHLHIHIGDDKNISKHTHEHSHNDQHAHLHTHNKKNTSAWVLFIIFVFGPCEPLIPLLIYPASQKNVFSTVMVCVVFGLITIGTMMTVVFMARAGLSVKLLNKADRYTHAIAGLTILICGCAIEFLGL